MNDAPDPHATGATGAAGFASRAGLQDAHVARYRELLAVLGARLDWTPDQVAAERDRALRELLCWAAQRSPWHRERLAAIEPNAMAVEALSSLPVMTKADLMDNFDLVVTDARLTRAACEAHLDHGGHLLEEYHVVASGGSSGHRGVFVYGWDAWATLYASINRFQIRQWTSDEEVAGVPRISATVAASHPGHVSAAVRTTFTDPSEPATLLPVSLPLGEIVARLNAMSPTVLMGYSSFLSRLAVEARAGRLTIAPRRVITISEPLLAEHRALLEETWGTPVANNYGMSEGIFSGHCGYASHLPDDLCILEPVDEEGQPVPAGQTSARVLVTNLYNHVLPLIRYEVSDQLAVTPGTCPCGCAFSRVSDVQGRLDDMFVYGDGTLIHPHVFRSVFGKDRSVLDYQVRQTISGAKVVLVSQETHTKELTRKLEAALASAGMTRPAVEVELSPDLVRGNFGKLRRFVPLSEATMPKSVRD